MLESKDDNLTVKTKSFYSEMGRFEDCTPSTERDRSHFNKDSICNKIALLYYISESSKLVCGIT